MMNNTINYKGVELKGNNAKYLKYMDMVDEYREELVSLSKSWDNLALLSHFGNSSTNINETKNNFSKLTSTLLNHLSSEVLDKTIREMKFKAQISIDILIRNLFERTADIGFLSTDQDIKNFLVRNTNKYTQEYVQEVEKIKNRFKEYTQKYSVYYDIVLMDTHGNILVQLDESSDVEKSKDEIISYALNCNEEYIETFKYHDFIPKRKKSLVYTLPVKSDDESNKPIGVLSLCFRFQDEMKAIFDNLKSERNKECLTILDKEGVVIASSDHYHIALGTKLTYNITQEYQIVSHGGRDYLARSCKTNGYQGYYGQQWYGHIMVPMDYAFLEDEDNLNINAHTLLAILQEGDGFSDELKEIPLNANKIQVNLNRLVWNGNITKNASDNNNKNFSRALLNEISATGEKTKQIFDLSIANLTKTIILNNTSLVASLMVDIMDRNLYERANDCRWWALTSVFKKILSSNDIDDVSNQIKLSEVLQYINSLYTVYTNLFVYDANGVIMAVSNESEKELIGKQLDSDVVAKTMHIQDSNDYFVSPFHQTKLYNNEHTYIYYAAIKDGQKCVGGIGVVFDSKVEFQAMLEESIPGFEKSKNSEVFGIYANKDKSIIASSNPDLKVGDTLKLSDTFFNLSNGQTHSEIIVYDNKYYAVGVKCSQGYREYKTSDSYENDVYALFFSYISSGNLNIEKRREVFTEAPALSSDNTAELATFFIGGKWLGVHIEDVIEAVSVDKLDITPTMDNTHHFKGTVVYNNKAVAVIDIRNYIDEQPKQAYEEIVIVKDYDNDESYIGILVNSLGDIPEVNQSRIKTIDNKILGNCTLITSIVTPLENVSYNKLLSLLDVKKLKEHLVQE